MDINVIGGGPGGLYASILLQKEHPNWDISVFERDPKDNTYGWGIVFSDNTLSGLREADYKSHDRITEQFALWDPIDIHYDDKHIRCGGHTFSGIMRADLKDILRERCDELGVEMHWGHNVENPEEYREDVDLLIGADGLNSVTRETWEDQFKPRTKMGQAKFAWFGTENPFDVFTFIFRENEHGLWRVHAYPGRKSTFIVECREETWIAAGLDEKDEQEGLAYFENLFSDHLEGYELESKLYNWRNFPIVENRTWSHDNIVLLGDAAHTAHFSVGAGTKMALEDAIALHEGFQEYDSDNIEGALNWYEKERRPRVEGIQKAAKQSRIYFEQTERYTDLPPEQFAFNLLTRSGRISYDELKIRDDEYADNFDRWYAQFAESGNEPKAVATPPMFQSFTLAGVTLWNRAVFAPGPSSVGTNGNPAPEQTQRLVELGTDSPGLVLTEPVAVARQGRISPGTPGIYDDNHADAWAAAVSAVHEAGNAKVGIELFHAGQRAATKPREYGLDRPLPEGDSWDIISATAEPYTDRSQMPKAMDGDDIKQVRDQFADAASRAADADFDVLQLNVAHGYLLSSFLSPLTNNRDDEYGGDLDNRLRYPIEVFDAVRSVWPDDRPITVKMPATDWRPDGNNLGDAFRIGSQFDEAGADLLTIVAGQTTANDRPKFDTDILARYSEQIRNELNVPTMTTNYITSTDEINTQVGSGTGDLCHWYPPGTEVNSL